MMASPNDYMYIIFPCLTTYLMQVLKMNFFVQQKKQSAKKHSAENIKQKSFSRKQQKSIPKKAYSIQQKSISQKSSFFGSPHLGRFVLKRLCPCLIRKGFRNEGKVF